MKRAKVTERTGVGFRTLADELSYQAKRMKQEGFETASLELEAASARCEHAGLSILEILRRKK